MQLLFVRADKIGSKIIRWGTSEDCSHVAAMTSLRGPVFHSYGTGVQTVPANQFHQLYETVHSLVIPMDSRQEKRALEYLLSCANTKNSYDYPALAYFGVRVALHKFLKVGYPKLNPWQTTEGFLCTEVVYHVAEIYTAMTGRMILPDRDLSMVTPYQLYMLLKETVG